MATFRCLQSGNTVTFTYQYDIDTMKGHQGYVRVDQEEVETKPVVLAPPKPIKKAGRPKKVENV
ncbi:hypothetical protein UFOVP308_38 [uncultured Caudovirales phage]|uniref:Uncharacterized protein n=1 Tax=uncultured Caudovirales phage TaxID=2100421 RepID=A0A6J5LPV9_9CAUD|nr:hypothetical protein UFOVP308_38 [uncultured Caudovirales phage]